MPSCPVVYPAANPACRPACRPVSPIFPRATPALAPLLALLLAGSPAAWGAELPDTGQTTCYTDSAYDPAAVTDPASVAREGGSYPRQDCRFGRDAAAALGTLTKVGGGTAGFDYTKLANDGGDLPANASLGTASHDWACTRDNVTGLTWEIPNTASPLFNIGYRYTWYQPDSSLNGGDPGSTGTDTCSGSLPGGLCNTHALVTAANGASLCGYQDWRLPSRRELITLLYLYFGSGMPLVDFQYFPLNGGDYFWSSNTYAPDTTNAWQINMFGADLPYSSKQTTGRVMLVRGTAF